MQERLINKRNSGIDILRGISVIAVILLHINIRIPFSVTYIGSILPKMMYSFLFWSGYYGVCIFFVVSGFLITTTSLNRWVFLPGVSLRGFYTMRFARIMPLLVGLLVVLSVLHLSGITDFVINPAKTSLARALFAALTFQINWLEMKVGYLPGSWDVLWTLSLEEVFYLFFPVFCIICRKEWHFVALLSVFLIIGPFARIVWFSENELGDHNNFAYMDAIALGCIAALVAKRITIKKHVLNSMSFVGWGFIILIMIFRRLAKQLYLIETGLNVTMLAIGTALVLIGMQQRFTEGKQLPSKFSAAFRYLGRNSYEVYLTHMFIVLLFVNMFKSLELSGEWAWLLYISILIASAMLGDLVARYFSNPLNSLLREKFKTQIVSDSQETVGIK
jgi:peptidoglycan/LPS O-acetylase OafA/YrhL